MASVINGTNIVLYKYDKQEFEKYAKLREERRKKAQEELDKITKAKEKYKWWLEKTM